MLSRTADNIFWLSRYMERADNMARLMEMGYRMALVPKEGKGHMSEWRSVLESSGCLNSFEQRFKTFNQKNIIEHLILDKNNPSSIYSCIQSARWNGRAIRNALTTQMWESLNETWLKIKTLTLKEANKDLPGLLDWIKDRGALFRGITETTAYQDDVYDFLRLGTFIERLDNTARLLDVKYYVLLPKRESVGGSVDHYQWTSVLRATSSLRIYHWVYKDDFKPWRIAELLILDQSSPRSLLYCIRQVHYYLEQLALLYGQNHECQTIAEKLAKELQSTDIEEIV